VVFTSTSTDPDGDSISLSWDLDGDNAFDDDSGPTATRSFPTTGSKVVRVRGVDSDGGEHVARRAARRPRAGRAPPVRQAPPPAAP